ncbi:MAG TPA: tryptophan 7-halogenase [Terracidiphilus sp.]|nr:tryptophan 7-halogenase [Terracidiphilus sp.]
MIFDVAVIGGGPAGSAAALSFRKIVPEAKIAIFDAGRLQRWKPGETLAPGATEILESLGCLPSFQHAIEHNEALESFGTKAAWGADVPYEREFLFSLHGNGWRLDRARFDVMLLERAEARGIDVFRNTALKDSLEEESGWRLRFAGGEHRARFVIDATGRAARFAAQRGVRPIVSDNLAGVFVLFKSATEGDTLIEAAESGWWYSTTVPGSTAVAAWMSDTDLIRQMTLRDSEQWNALLAQSTHTRIRLCGAESECAPGIFAAHSQRLSEFGGPRWIAAGDAAMTFDPLSSQGILKALRSGKLASFVAADFLLRGADTLERYARLAAAEYAAYEQAKRDFYRKEMRWPSAPFWARRQAEPPVNPSATS